jgi:hypothetical protein
VNKYFDNKFRSSSIHSQVDGISALSLTWDNIDISGKSFDSTASAITSFIIDLFKDQLKVGGLLLSEALGLHKSIAKTFS